MLLYHATAIHPVLLLPSVFTQKVLATDAGARFKPIVVGAAVTFEFGDVKENVDIGAIPLMATVT